MSKKENTPIEQMTKEELIKKCHKQKQMLKELNDKIKIINSKNLILETALSETPLHHKLQVCMTETLSYINDIEKLKKENQKLKEQIK